jgi:hypothetical protein
MKKTKEELAQRAEYQAKLRDLLGNFTGTAETLPLGTEIAAVDHFLQLRTVYRAANCNRHIIGIRL